MIASWGLLGKNFVVAQKACSSRRRAVRFPLKELAEDASMKNMFEQLKSRKTKLGVVGIGYVGLPLVHAFAPHFDVVGFDVNEAKVELMKQGIDPTGEVPAGGSKRSKSTSPPTRKSSRNAVLLSSPCLLRSTATSGLTLLRSCSARLPSANICRKTA